MTQLDANTYHVDADTCRCSNPMCDVEQKPLSWLGRVCSTCSDGLMERDCYEVQLDEYDHNGFCSCSDFRIKHQPKLEAGRRGPAYRCKHIRKVLEIKIRCPDCFGKGGRPTGIPTVPHELCPRCGGTGSKK